MKKLFHRKKFYIFLGIIGALMFGIVGILIYCDFESRILRTVEYENLQSGTVHDGLELTVTRGIPWRDYKIYPGLPVGAQYDWELINYSGREFTNWSVDIIFPGAVEVNSSWNGVFSTSGNVLTYLPERNEEVDLTVVHAHSTRGFGAVIYSSKEMLPERATLTGYWQVNVLKLPVFWVLMTGMIITVFFGLLNVMLMYRTEKYRRQIEKDDEMIRQAMLTMTDFIDAKDSYTKGHSSRVAIYARELAKRLGVSEKERKNLYYIALMHDCGKVGVPDAVLKKPGKLTDDEFRLIQAHATVGNHLLTHFTSIPDISDGAHYHHERFDGSGYPDGLKGEEIPYVARIICIADAVDAMSTNRCYRDRLSEEELISELEEHAGTQFDPGMIPAMIELIHEGIIQNTQKEFPNRAT